MNVLYVGNIVKGMSVLSKDTLSFPKTFAAKDLLSIILLLLTFKVCKRTKD